jgi:hypothetical protein
MCLCASVYISERALVYACVYARAHICVSVCVCTFVVVRMCEWVNYCTHVCWGQGQHWYQLVFPCRVGGRGNIGISLFFLAEQPSAVGTFFCCSEYSCSEYSVSTVLQ